MCAMVKGPWRRRVKFPLDGEMAPNRATTSSVSEALKERVGQLPPCGGSSLKWSFTIPAEKGGRGENVFSGRPGLRQ